MPPGAIGSASQAPVWALQTPLTQFWVSAEQSFAAPAWQAPPRHFLSTMHGSPVSEQSCPSLVPSGVGSHLPVAGLHATALHSVNGEKVQSSGAPVQVPPW